MAELPSVSPAGWATGIGGGFGTGIVLEWAWNGFLATGADAWPTMTAPVAIALAGLGVFLLGGLVWCVHALVTALAFRLRGDNSHV